jgi:hypothetical protein
MTPTKVLETIKRLVPAAKLLGKKLAAAWDAFKKIKA